MAQAVGTNGCIVPWVIDRETVGGSGLTCTLYPVPVKKCGGEPYRCAPFATYKLLQGFNECGEGYRRWKLLLQQMVGD